MYPPFPPVDKALLDRLELHYPDRLPRGTADLSRLQGQQDVMDLLRREFKDQTDPDPEGDE